MGHDQTWKGWLNHEKKMAGRNDGVSFVDVRQTILSSGTDQSECAEIAGAVNQMVQLDW